MTQLGYASKEYIVSGPKVRTNTDYIQQPLSKIWLRVKTDNYGGRPTLESPHPFLLGEKQFMFFHDFSRVGKDCKHQLWTKFPGDYHSIVINTDPTNKSLLHTLLTGGEQVFKEDWKADEETAQMGVWHDSLKDVGYYVLNIPGHTFKDEDTTRKFMDDLCVFREHDEAFISPLNTDEDFEFLHVPGSVCFQTMNSPDWMLFFRGYNKTAYLHSAVINDPITRVGLIATAIKFFKTFGYTTLCLGPVTAVDPLARWEDLNTDIEYSWKLVRHRG